MLRMCFGMAVGMTVGVALAAQALPEHARLPLQPERVAVQAPRPGWELGMISSVAVDGAGRIYLLQRGLSAQPVVVIDAAGRVLREWGRGMYAIPHSVRVAPDGTIWTVDSGNSRVLQFTPEGKVLTDFTVSGRPARSSPFTGAADIAFAPGGNLLVADGYGNARVVEYDAAGGYVRQWGAPGGEPGRLHLPHGIAVSGSGEIFVADRENGRIQRFDRDGQPLGVVAALGKTFSLHLAGGALWIGTQPMEQPNGAPGWIMKLDPASGRVLGIVETPGHHSVHVTEAGEVYTAVRPNELLRFR